MTAVRSRGFAALFLVVAAVGCKKEGGATDATELPAELVPHPVHTDVAKLRVPALFASVPSDTPYLLGGLEPVPVELYAKLKTALGPPIERLFRMASASDGDHKLLDAILAELDGKWNAAGFESLGFSARPAFAVYGLGLQPVVLRLEVKDHKAVQATIERIAARAGETLPPPETRDGRIYWKGADSDAPAWVFALADNQLIAALGTRAEVEAKLGLILGADRPAQNMADGKLLKELIARHGFGAHLIGFADTRRLASAGAQAAGARPTPACTGEIDRLSAKIPRLVIGYGELSGARTSGGMVIELSPDLVADLRAMRTEIPGLAAALSDQPAIAVSVGLDLARGQKLAVAAAQNLERLGQTCEIPALASGARSAQDALSRPLPAPAGQISGALLAVRDFQFPADFARNPVPSKLDAVTVIASPDARALFAKLLELSPSIKALGIQPDGKLHDVGAAQLALPFPIAAGVADKVIVVASGDQRAALGDRMLGARARGKAPLFAVSYDYGKLLDLQMKAAAGAERDPLVQDLYTSLRNTFGRAAGAFDVTDAGLAIWGTLEIK